MRHYTVAELVTALIAHPNQNAAVVIVTSQDRDNVEDWREIDLTTGTEGWFDETPGDCVILEIDNSSSNL